MAFIDEVEAAEEKARARKAVPIAGVGVALLGLVVAFFALQGVFGGGGDFTVEHVGETSQTATVSTSAGGESSAQSASGATVATSSSSSNTGAIVVYVTGAVSKPGVYSFETGARVKDAIDAAGGFSRKASTSSLNLARALTDGEQIDVLTRKQAKSAQTGATAASAGTSASTSSAAAAVSSATSGAATGKININTATSAELQTLNGIGEVTAQKIIDYRESSGPFASPEDIKNVSGIGDKKYEAIASSICV